MDAESLAQIEQIVTTAVGGTEQRLRKEIATAASGTEDGLRKEMGTLGGSLRQEFGTKTDALAASIRQEFDERFEEAKRHSGVLFEEALHRIDLVVEGHQALAEKIGRIEARMEDGFGKVEHEFLELRSQIRLS